MIELYVIAGVMTAIGFWSTVREDGADALDIGACVLCGLVWPLAWTAVAVIAYNSYKKAQAAKKTGDTE